jgi:hypothetical protein
MPLDRRTFLTKLASMLALPRTGLSAEAAPRFIEPRQLEFLDNVPPDRGRAFTDDAKLLIGWVTDAAALDVRVKSGEIIDRRCTFAAVPGAAEPTPLDALAGRYRLVRPALKAHDYYGMLFGLLDGVERVTAVILVNRLFRLPVILEEPLGVGSDVWANAGLLLGFRTAALDAALAFADMAEEQASRLGVPLIATGQSQAGGTAQLQIAHLAAAGAGEGRIGFVTCNATCSASSIRRFGLDPARLPGVNFAKDLDPLVGPHTWLANRIGLQVYIHADGSAGLTPQSSYVRAVIHPREHFLDSFAAVSLEAALRSVAG